MLFVLCCLTVAIGQHFQSIQISNIGRIITLNVAAYQDPNCTVTLAFIDWGNVTANSSNSYLTYFRNEGNTPISLFLNTSNWQPQSISYYLTLSWDYTNQTLNSNDVLSTTFTLTADGTAEFLDYVLANNVTDFSFDIQIIGVEWR